MSTCCAGVIWGIMRIFCQYSDFSAHVSYIFQLQIESEERLHDYGERIRALQREKEDILSKLEDKQKDVDDLSFQLEEESISKADLEVNIKTEVDACVLFY